MRLRNRVLLIGLDGATWDLIGPWVGEGKLPTFERITRIGAHGVLDSTIPPHTAPGWTTAFTGVNPGKHNVFDFWFPNGYGRRYASFYDWKAEPLWRILSRAGLEVIVINVPLTFPPDPQINGIFISGSAPSIESDFTVPRSLRAKLSQCGYEIEAVGRAEKYLSRVISMEEKRVEVVLDLMKNEPWDFLAVVFVAPDRVQHRFWRYLGTSHPLSSAILDVHQVLDRLIARLINAAGPDCNTFIISDHGFGESRRRVAVNGWLKGKGLLSLKSSTYKRELRRWRLTRPTLRHLAYLVPRAWRGMVRGFVPTQETSPDEFDWSKTQAWLFSEGGRSIRLNLVGREPSGIVSTEDYEMTRSRIIDGLSKLADPLTGNSKLIKCHRREDIYTGAYARNGPDLLLELADGYNLIQSADGKVFQDSQRAWHQPDGVLLSVGPDVGFQAGPTQANLADICPTMLHLFGLKIPRYVDGNVLLNLFADGSRPKLSSVEYSEFNERSRVTMMVKSLKQLRKF